jgi:protein SCO1
VKKGEATQFIKRRFRIALLPSDIICRMTTLKNVPKAFALTLLAGVAFVIGVYVAAPRHQTHPDIPGLLWPDPPQLSAFSLTDKHGARLTEGALAGKWTLLFFGFTHCPDVCPTTLKVLSTVATQLRTQKLFGAQGQVLFVSIDPARDGPAAIKTYVEYFDPSFNGATGTDDELKQFTRQLGVIYAKVRTADPDVYSMDHTASVLLIGPRLQLLGVFSPPFTADALARQTGAIIDFVPRG